MANKLDNKYEFNRLANKYYGKSVEDLTPTQLDKVIGWATNTNPDKQGKISGRKYSGKTYGKLKKIF
tara:strand:+ start:8968 stop:9168 length:201 start_codon:yes stop_codon:yes gene_type:complete